MTSTAPVAVSFEVLDPEADGAEVDPQGAWHVATAEAVSFAASSGPRDELPVVWRVHVSTARDGGALLTEARHASQLDARVAGASDRVRALLREREHGPVSFATPAADTPSAETELSSYLDGAVSFGVGDDEAPSGVAATLERLWRRATRVARVETSIGLRDVAVSEVSLLGDVTTTLLPDATPQDATTHQRSLAATLRTRRAWGRIVIQTLQVALLLNTGNVFAALPAAWRFVRAVMAEVRALERAEAA